MITDAQNRPSNQQSLAGAAATTVSTDSIDLLTANRHLGRSGPMRAVANVTLAAAGGTSVKAELIESANADLSSPTVLAAGPTVVTANATAGAELIDVPVPDTSKRYLGFQYTTVGTMTALKVSAHIVAATDNNTYPTMNTGL